MEQISDYYRYTQLMRNGFYDKLFFIDKIYDEWNTLLDYGCADGFQTKILANIFPDKQIIGYDYDKDMINRALYTGAMPGNVRFTDNLSETSTGDIFFGSSIVHEVYSYAKSKDDITRFWNDVFHPDRKFVVIRDMSVDISTPYLMNLSTVMKVKKWVEDHHFNGELAMFEERFGPINEARNFAHFILKWPYLSSPNWHREVHENYSPISSGEIIKLAPEDWKVDYQETYTLPFLKWKIRKEIGIDLPMKTHYKLILRNLSQG